jgi:hypothetical protein
VFNGADHLKKAPFAHPGRDANLHIAHRLARFSAYNATLARKIYTILPSLKRNLICCLQTCKHGCMFVGCTSREWSLDMHMVHNNCLDYPDSRTETRCHLLHDLTPLLLTAPGGFGLVLGFCLGTLPNPSWLDPGASDRSQHLALQTTTSHQAKKRFWST